MQDPSEALRSVLRASPALVRLALLVAMAFVAGASVELSTRWLRDKVVHPERGGKERRLALAAFGVLANYLVISVARGASGGPAESGAEYVAAALIFTYAQGSLFSNVSALLA